MYTHWQISDGEIQWPHFLITRTIGKLCWIRSENQGDNSFLGIFRLTSVLIQGVSCNRSCIPVVSTTNPYYVAHYRSFQQTFRTAYMKSRSDHSGMTGFVAGPLLSLWDLSNTKGFLDFRHHSLSSTNPIIHLTYLTRKPPITGKPLNPPETNYNYIHDQKSR